MTKSYGEKLSSRELLLGIIAIAPRRREFRDCDLEAAIGRSVEEHPELRRLLAKTGTDGSTPNDGGNVIGRILSFAAMGKQIFDVGDFQHDVMPESAALTIVEEIKEEYGDEGIEYLRRISKNVWDNYNGRTF
ncbi:hypothetical protein COU61_03685 [Candidatus Pacearchaeota archaeon CG10_big_fil_rev_8_21_14_0_10_35_13]|nr:MAG: hypothetical protein COU61_03685 [Candidatus Pacearchaeota archaeon CG10_big_fil_rev_8_21_14_0_10_35_13]